MREIFSRGTYQSELGSQFLTEINLSVPAGFSATYFITCTKQKANYRGLSRIFFQPLNLNTVILFSSGIIAFKFLKETNLKNQLQYFVHWFQCLRGKISSVIEGNTIFLKSDYFNCNSFSFCTAWLVDAIVTLLAVGSRVFEFWPNKSERLEKSEHTDRVLTFSSLNMELIFRLSNISRQVTKNHLIRF